MEVKLVTYTGKEFGESNFSIKSKSNQADLLGRIASRSRSIENVNKDGIYKTAEENKQLFKQTIEWGHESIQEFCDFIFDVRDVSRSLLAQLTRHRMASYNVVSFRHVVPTKFNIGNFESIKSTSEHIIDNIYRLRVYIIGDKITWDLYRHQPEGLHSWVKIEIHDTPYNLNDFRMFFPMGSLTSLYMKFNGRSIRNLLRLRLDTHAAPEIRELACKAYDLVKEVNPILVETEQRIKPKNLIYLRKLAEEPEFERVKHNGK